MEEQLDYEALSSNAGLGANMLAGALVSPTSVYTLSWHVLVLPMLLFRL